MTVPVDVDRFGAARAVADAVLYEGYVLYPYRASATKNQLRWQFGVLVPRACSAVDGSERSAVRTECIVDPGFASTLAVRIRCLQVQNRAVESAVAGGTQFVATDRLDSDGTVYVPWDEAVEHIVDLTAVPLSALIDADREHPFRLPTGADIDTVRQHDGSLVGRVVRHREAVDGCVRISAERVAERLVKVAVVVENTTDWSRDSAPRDEVISHSLVAVHTMLALDDGAFVSLLDPPADAREAVAGCVNDGTFPVLIGAGDVMLSSPIILYDQPQVAPESPGDLYDATEIDEILALRVLTLTDDEKAEARATDPRAAGIIDRCDDMPPELWARLHGAIRSVQPAVAPETAFRAETGPEHVPWWDPGVDGAVDPSTDSLWIAGVDVRKGSAVRLRPSRRADAHDLFFDGLSATVAGIFRDVDGNDHVAVTIDDDPATEALEWQRRYLYFYPDEVEPLGAGGAS